MNIAVNYVGGDVELEFQTASHTSVVVLPFGDAKSLLSKLAHAISLPEPTPRGVTRLGLKRETATNAKLHIMRSVYPKGTR